MKVRHAARFIRSNASAISVACFVSVFASAAFLVFLLAPTRSSILQNSLASGRDLPGIGLPEAGTKLVLPSKDLFGRAINLSRRQVIVAMPGCASCLLHKIKLPELAKLSTSPVILAFPEQPPKQLDKAIRGPAFRVFVDPSSRILPGSSYVFAPTTLVTDSTGKVLTAFRTLEEKNHSGDLQ